MNAHNLPGMSGSAAIKAFVVIAYALSITLSLVVWLTGGHERPLIGLRYLSMFIPAVAVLIVNSAMNEDLQGYKPGTLVTTTLPVVQVHCEGNWPFNICLR
jgi:hypothetical protein